MSGYWLVSYVVLWALVLGLSLVVIALLRQVGVLHLRLSPTGALDTGEGPPLGERAPRPLTPEGREALVVFGSESCGMCRDLLPSATALARSDPHLSVVVASTSSAFAGMAEPPATAVADPVAVSAFRVKATPFAVYVDPDGVVRAKGIVNTLEHLESLVDQGRRRSSEAREGTRA